MPTFERNGVSLYYEEFGSGFPILLFAPGGMRSAVDFWHRSPFDPTKEFAADFRVIAMDQRNATPRSRGPVSATDGWMTYTNDHLALLDHLKIDRCHVMGGCIGSSYCLSIAQAAPNRIISAVLQNPIGLHENRSAFREMFDGWALELREAGVADDATFKTFRESMYGSDFVFSVSRDFLRSCTIPMVVLRGDDLYHPGPISDEIVQLNPKIGMIRSWKAPDVAPTAAKQVREFLKQHSR
ncbi:MAG TPA: alpha/beta hydrolase [Candidatus Binataceae bacterium]|nr:alpha/beta hydrolase [Candidatus Binataceae bacterium]